MSEDDSERRLVAFFAPQIVIEAIDRAAECSLTTRSTFLRQAIWRDLKREGYASDLMLADG